MAAPADHRGYVYSPHTPTRKLVNVRDFKAGQTALCPYTLKPFVVPGASRQSIAGVLGQPAGSSVAGTGSEPRPSDAPPGFGPPSVAQVTPVLAEESGGAGPVDARNPAVEEVPISPLAELAETEGSSIPKDFTTPYGTWVEGKPGHVYSPFAARHQLVDVTGLPFGTDVQCPFSGKVFRVPESEQPAVALESSLPEPVTSDIEPPQWVPYGPEWAAATNPPEPVHAEGQDQASPLPKPTGPSKYGAAISRPSQGTSATTGSPTGGLATPQGFAGSSAASPAAEKPKPKAETELPTAAWVPNQPGLVQSPFGKPGQLVDVSGKSGGSKVVCPYTNKPFRVPPP